MNFDWQTAAVLLIIAGALLYVARRGLARLRSFRSPKGGGCATGCGTCGDVDAPVRQTSAPVRLERSKTSAGARRG